jgi:MFS family permease
MAVYGCGMLASSLLGGHLADRIGRRRTICLSGFGAATALLALSQVHRLAVTLLAAGSAGLLSGAYQPAAAALLADLVAPGQRVVAYGLYRTSVNAGVAAGGVIAGLLADISYTWVFVTDAGTSAVFGLLALTALPGHAKASGTPDRAARIGPAVDRRLAVLLAATALIAFVFYQYQAGLPIRLRQLHYSPALLGVLMSVNGLLVVVAQMPVSAWARRHNVMPLGFVLIGAGFALNGAAGAIPLLVVSVLVWTAGEMVMAPAAMSRIAELAPDGRQGRYQGYFAFTLASGQVTAPTALLMPPAVLWSLCGAFGLAAGAAIHASDSRHRRLGRGARGTGGALRCGTGRRWR